MATIADADRIAENAHAGQQDKAGAPYIDHPRAVAEMLRECGDSYVMAALLHDVVEDTDVTLDDLRAAGFPREVVHAVDAVTRRDNETYMTFIARAAADPMGCLVKLADNLHNSSRLHNLEEPVRSGLERRYRRARDVLLAAADRHAAAKALDRLTETYTGPALEAFKKTFEERFGARSGILPPTGRDTAHTPDPDEDHFGGQRYQHLGGPRPYMSS